MTKIKSLLLACLILTAFTSCFEDLDDNASSTRAINDFVWKAMNVSYVYKENITDLDNADNNYNKFNSNEDYTTYLDSFDRPEDLFESLIHLRNDVDEFSAIVPNYNELEQILQGTRQSNGMAFGVRQLSNGKVFGYVRYVMPNTSAETQGVQRGMVFNAVDGEILTANNFRNLLFGSNSTYTINLATYDDNGTLDDDTDDDIIATAASITLTKAPYTENPILTHNIINQGSSTIGYLMYNGFRLDNTFLSELNSVFADFQAANITDLVLDLRYNGGGSVSTAIWLASMINGQNIGELFFKEQWNPQIQTDLEANNPDALINPFVNEMVVRNSNGDITFQENINSLNLSKVYVLTTRSTASASELVINGLSPYLDVVQIGNTTRGKPQASITLYDSEDFSRNNVNQSHTYALQPLIYESENANGFSQYYDGIDPTLESSELYSNLGVLGDVNEPFLALAIADITGTGRFSNTATNTTKDIADNHFENPLHFEMLDNRPLNFK